jgi:hypothetical protein
VNRKGLRRKASADGRDKKRYDRGAGKGQEGGRKRKEREE